MREISPVTIKDIAKICGVSSMSVSRALRGIEGVSPAKREEIQKVAAELNYVLNSNARSLVKASSDLVGISFPSLFNDVFSDMLEGMRTTFDREGISTVVNTTDYSEETERDWVRRLMSWRPAGVVLTGVHHHHESHNTLQSAGIPTVEIWDISEDPIDLCVGIDHTDAGRQLGRLAVSLGYRRPGYVTSPTGKDQRADQRLHGVREAFRETLDAAPLAVSIQQDRNLFLSGQNGTIELADGPAPPDVIFFVNDHLAFGGLAACASLGLQVPRDIGIVGFNALDLTAVLEKPMTTASTPRRLIGETAARELIARIRGARRPPLTVLPVQLLPGETTVQQIP